MTQLFISCDDALDLPGFWGEWGVLRFGGKLRLKSAQSPCPSRHLHAPNTKLELKHPLGHTELHRQIWSFWPEVSPWPISSRGARKGSRKEAKRRAEAEIGKRQTPSCCPFRISIRLNMIERYAKLYNMWQECSGTKWEYRKAQASSSRAGKTALGGRRTPTWGGGMFETHYSH